MQHIAVGLRAALATIGEAAEKGGPVVHYYEPVWRQTAAVFAEACMPKAEQQYEKGKRLCESPIECIALAAMLVGLPNARVVKNLTEAEQATDEASTIIIPQLKFERYRLDFAILAGRRGDCRIFGLECDGRDFHGYDDKRRDNHRSIFLWGCGVQVHRATGYSLYRDALAAVLPLVTLARRYQ